MTINANQVIIRPATHQDDAKQIAKLLCLSDLNIYPAMFGNEENAAIVLEQLLSSNTINLSSNQLIVADYNGFIAGILFYIENKYIDDQLAYQQAFAKLNIPLPEHFDSVFTMYWKKLMKEDFSNSYYISNIAVDENHQGLGIGKRLLQYMKEHHADKPIKLDVVKNNTTAIGAYQKSGFKIVETPPTNSPLPTPYRMIYQP